MSMVLWGSPTSRSRQRMAKYRYLDTIQSPADLRKVPVQDLRIVCQELREFLVDSVSKTGGHLGAGLGAVELAVALHYAYNTPQDKLIWDVGHQAYPHKILTGRKDRFDSLRKLNGISGFLKRSESEYDVFGAGHASTSISAALGVAAGRDFSGEKYKVAAIIGDGSMTGGMVYEAMNNAGMLQKDITVILNDNRMSIAENVWTLHNYFSEILTHPTYNKFKANVWSLTGKLDTFGDRLRSVAQQFEKGVKAVVTPGMLFEALGFRYFGPFNGHNIVKMVEVFQHVRELSGPIFVHVITEKGKGYAPAEKDVQRLHGVVPFDKITGASPKDISAPPSFTKIFGTALVEICKTESKVVGITAAMPDGTGIDLLQKAMPGRAFDVGIAEQHAVTFAAGLATQGYVPVVAVYSSFLQRAYDQIIHDVALQELHVVFALDRAGLVGADGPTHHGAYDLSYLRCIPGMVIMCPGDENELRDMLYTAIRHQKGPIALRYPRGNAFGLPKKETFDLIPIGKAERVREGKDVAILAVGSMVHNALGAAELLAAQGLNAEVVNMRFAKPIDTEMVEAVARRFSTLVTVEENSIAGGFGSAVATHIATLRGTRAAVHVHGIPDEFVEQGSPAELHAITRLDSKGIAEVVGDVLRRGQER